MFRSCDHCGDFEVTRRIVSGAEDPDRSLLQLLGRPQHRLQGRALLDCPSHALE